MAEQRGGRDAALLLDMLLAARDAQDFVAGLDAVQFLASRLHQSAVVRALEVIGEAAGKVSPGTQIAHQEIAWRDIIGMRHRLIHGYADVDLDLIWSVTQNRIPALIASIEKLIQADQAGEPPGA
jgi:uncharacterized protein with HEPN domain